MIKRVYFCFSGLKIYSAGSDLARSADSLKKNKTRKLIHLKCEIFTLLKKKNLHANVFIKSILRPKICNATESITRA